MYYYEKQQLKHKGKKLHDLAIRKWNSGEYEVDDLERIYKKLNKRYGTEYVILSHRIY